MLQNSLSPISSDNDQKSLFQVIKRNPCWFTQKSFVCGWYICYNFKVKKKDMVLTWTWSRLLPCKQVWTCQSKSFWERLIFCVNYLAGILAVIYLHSGTSNTTLSLLIRPAPRRYLLTRAELGLSANKLYLVLITNNWLQTAAQLSDQNYTINIEYKWTDCLSGTLR